VAEPELDGGRTDVLRERRAGAGKRQRQEEREGGGGAGVSRIRECNNGMAGMAFQIDDFAESINWALFPHPGPQGACTRQARGRCSQVQEQQQEQLQLQRQASAAAQRSPASAARPLPSGRRWARSRRAGRAATWCRVGQARLELAPTRSTADEGEGEGSVEGEGWQRKRWRPW